MVREAEPIDIAEITDSASLVKLAEEVRRTRIPRVLQRNKHDVAILGPIPQAPAPRSRGRRNDALVHLLAIADSGDARSTGPTDISNNKQKYLAEAYATDAGSAES
jgi:hypothetical protein